MERANLFRLAMDLNDPSADQTEALIDVAAPVFAALLADRRGAMTLPMV